MKKALFLMTVVVLVCAVVTPPASAFEHRGPRLMTVLAASPLLIFAIPGAVLFGVEEGVSEIVGSSESRDEMRAKANFCFTKKALNLDAVDFLPPFSSKQFKEKKERIGSALREHGWPFEKNSVVAAK